MARETKTCETCGVVFERPPTYNSKLWASRRFCSQRCWGRAKSAAYIAKRETLTCPTCGTGYTSPHGSRQKTCGDKACIARYRQEISGPAASKRMKADYAAGRRKPPRGVSGIEEALWPHLREHGWWWRVRWTDAWGSFELDFAKPHEHLNVEIDGPEHAWGKRGKRDTARDAELTRRGWRILRVSNDEVDADPEAAAKRILAWAD